MQAAVDLNHSHGADSTRFARLERLVGEVSLLLQTINDDPAPLRIELLVLTLKLERDLERARDLLGGAA